MSLERITWTALPYHRWKDGRLRLSIFVSPRLSNDDGSATERKLGEFASFADWPRTLADIRFSVVFDDGTRIEDLGPSRTADSDLWHRLFPESTPVRPFKFEDHATKDLHTFPVRPVLQFIQSIYGRLGAESPTDFPAIDDPGSAIRLVAALGDMPSRIRRSASFRQELDRAAKEPGSTSRVVTETAATPNQATFTEAYRFYYRPGSRRPDFDPDTHIEKSPETPKHDFHERVALLGDQPELLRRLGLVLDLALDDAGVGPTGRVWVEPHGPIPPAPTPPATAYDLEGPYFGAQPTGSLRFLRGLLVLNREWFDLYQVDVDGAAMKLVDFAATLGNLKDRDRRSNATPSQAGVPSLRSGGLAVSRWGRADQLLDDLVATRTTNKDLESGKQVVLHAEDLTRGFRVDVFDENAPGGARWFSLHHRRSRHAIADLSGGQPPIEIEHDDEGYVKGVSASSERHDNPKPSDDLYLHEAMFGWDGWSLAAPRPGKRIVEPGEGEKGGSFGRYDPTEKNPLPIVTETDVWPRSLPRLRFGHHYRVRARLVDLAGNSLDFSEDELGPADGALTIGPQPYLRFEPVPSPAVLRRRIDTEGESLEHLVIRSNRDTSAQDYASDAAVQAALKAAKANHAYFEDSQRHLAAPKGSLQMAEQLERLEGAFSGGPGAGAARLVALREEGTFLDRKIIDLTTGAKSIAQLGRQLYLPAATPPVQADPDLPKERGQVLPEGAYVMFSSNDVLLPYLPDALAIGVSLTGFDIAGNEVFHRVAPFTGAWPEPQPFRLRLMEGASPGATFASGVLEVTLPKAHVVRARISSVFAKDELGKLAIWNWIATKTPELEKAALEGRHWMLTPFREIVFTHAVQQPLAVPSFEKVTVSRNLGDTFASFTGPILCDAKSTGRLDVLAEWTEDVDILTDDLPRAQRFAPESPAVELRAVAFGFTLDPDEDEARVTRYAKAEAGWRWCERCEGLVRDAPSAARCPAGGVHDLSASGNYALALNDPDAPGQAGWRHCAKCDGLIFGAVAGPCPAGGAHAVGSSGSYTLVHDDPAAKGQHSWRWCKKCQGLAFLGGVPGACPGGGWHDHSGSGRYTLRLVATQPVDRISQHAFGDTKYRKVTYHSVATTRFREFFPRTITDESANIQRVEATKDTLVRRVLNSARPAAPDIVYIIPTFQWDRRKATHVRKGKGVRVYLRRPWFSSGDGELLGVVLKNPPASGYRFDHVVRRKRVRSFHSPPPFLSDVPLDLQASGPPHEFELGEQVHRGETSGGAVELGKELVIAHPFFTIKPADDPLAPYVTDWGVDPVWKSQLPRSTPLVSDFPRHVAYAHGLTLEELPGSTSVTVAAHEVFFDRNRKLWYCDIDVDPGATYYPFLRLALARYQPNSVVGAHVSRVAMTDFIQLAPDRTASIEARDTEATVTVSGFSGRNVVADVMSKGLPDLLRDLYFDPDAPNTAVFATVEAYDPAIGGDLGWRPITDPMKLPVAALNDFHVTWSGSLSIPAATRGSGRHRVLVTETETYLRTDIEEGDPNYSSSPADFVRDRIVYADAFEL